MQRDGLMGGIFGGGVDFAADQRARRGSISVVQKLPGDCRNQRFKLFGRAQAEVLKEDCSFLQ